MHYIALTASIDIPLIQKKIQDSMKIFKALTFFFLITTLLNPACSTSKNNLGLQLKAIHQCPGII